MIKVDVKPYRMKHAVTNEEWDEDFGEEMYEVGATVDTGVDVCYASRFLISKLQVKEKYITKEKAFIRAASGGIIKFVGYIRISMWAETGHSIAKLWIRDSLPGRDFGIDRGTAEELGIIPTLNKEAFEDYSETAGYKLYKLNYGI